MAAVAVLESNKLGQFDPRRKILTLKQLIPIVEDLKQEDRKVVATTGHFDILCRGYTDHLALAALQGNVLIVGINSDESVRRPNIPGRPINSEDDRAFVLAALASVDLVCIFDGHPDDWVSMLQPDVYVKGEK